MSSYYLEFTPSQVVFSFFSQKRDIPKSIDFEISLLRIFISPGHPMAPPSAIAKYLAFSKRELSNSAFHNFILSIYSILHTTVTVSDTSTSSGSMSIS
jgi:hypothetical protein